VAKFDDKVAIVTGASGGIGFATSRRLAGGGARIAMLDRGVKPPELAQELRASGAPDAQQFQCDVASEQQVAAAVEGVLAHFGRLDIIVSNAAVMVFKALEDQTDEDWRHVLEINLLGAVRLVRQGFRNMQPGSAIVIVSSVHAERTTPLVSSYAASKAGLLSLARSAAIEGKPKGIRVNAVVPGAVDTKMLWQNPNLKSGAEQLAPEDVGKPEDVAAAIAFLASDDAEFITGTTLQVDGGRLSRL